MHPITRLASLTLLAAAPAWASPTQLSRSGFDTALAPLTQVVETFEGFTSGFTSPTITLANATYTANAPYVGVALGSSSKVLLNQTPDEPDRVFSNVAAGTTLFGLDLQAILREDELDLTVGDTTGSFTFRQTMAQLRSFVGIQDTAGLVSVSLRNLGTQYGAGLAGMGNCSFDNVTTGAASSVGVPGTDSPALGIDGGTVRVNIKALDFKGSHACTAALGAGRNRVNQILYKRTYS